MREWSEAIERDYSHPCIVVWVPFNESWGVPDLPAAPEQRHAVQALYHLTKTLDPTRPVIGNDGWESAATDIIGIHDYDADPEHICASATEPRSSVSNYSKNAVRAARILTLDGYPHRGQPIMLTEFGGIAYDKRRAAGVENAWGYSVAHERRRVCPALRAAAPSGRQYRAIQRLLLHAIH